MENLVTAISMFFNFEVLLAIISGVVIGVIIGAIPGMTATMGVAVLLPVTFYLPPLVSFGLLIGVYKGGIYGGSITAILVNTPGTPASAATAIDGYVLSQKGRSREALEMALYSSAIGSFIACFILIFASQLLAKIALVFGAPEFFAVLLFSLTLLGAVSGDNIIKGVLSGSLGLLIACIGIDKFCGVPRFVFGIYNLNSGLSFIPILIGMYAVSEFFIQLEEENKEGSLETKKVTGHSLKFRRLKEAFPLHLRSSLIGTVIGALPGLGPAIAAFAAYGFAKKTSKEAKLFGKGSLDGVAAAESANNAVCDSSLIPMLSLGIPGDVVSAVLLGALLIQGLPTGPMLFKEHGEIVIGIYLIAIISIFILLIFGSIFLPYVSKLATIRGSLLFPGVLICCVVGSFSINNNLFDVGVMFFAGIIGYFLRKCDIPLAPLNIALILGPKVEFTLKQSLTISDGNWLIFLTRPISLVFCLLTVLSICYFTFGPSFSIKKKEVGSL